MVDIGPECEFVNVFRFLPHQPQEHWNLSDVISVSLTLIGFKFHNVLNAFLAFNSE